MSYTLSVTEYNFLRTLSEQWMGSVFGEDKAYLFESRLPTMVKKFGYDGMPALLEELKRPFISQDKKNFFIDLITTHETLFFRDKSPFKCIKEVILPDLLEKKPKLPFYIYSAACSTGQEPVSVMIQLNEIFSRQGGHDFKILGTDISEACVETAKNGLYSQYEVQRGLPTKLLSKYFQQEDTSWRLQDEYKKHLTFMWENLLMPERKLMKFDLVLCRNVTIYMDPPKVRNIYEKIHASMNTGGWLLIGHSERMTDHADLFEFVKTDSGIAYRSK